MVYSLLLLPNIAWPFLFTSMHSLSMPATPLYKWDFFWIRNSCWDPWWSIYSDIYIWFYDIIYYIYHYITYYIYVSCGICMYISKGGLFIMLHFGCFWLQRFGAAFSWVDHQRTPRELDFNEATRVDCLKMRARLLPSHREMTNITMVWSF